MNYSTDLTDILNTLVTGMSFPVTVGSTTATADGYELRCDNIYHAQTGFDVVINSATYRIVDFNQSTETITVTGTGTISPGDTFQMYGVKFFHGVPIATAQELDDMNNSAIDNAQNKTPMIWLWEDFSETDEDDTPQKSIDCELYFLTQANTDSNKTQDAYDKAIKPMKRLLELFKLAVKGARAIFDADVLPVTTKNYAKFGVTVRTKGTTTNLFGDKLAGIEAKFKFKIWITETCDADFTIDTEQLQFDNSFDNSFA